MNGRKVRYARSSHSSQHCRRLIAVATCTYGDSSRSHSLLSFSSSASLLSSPSHRWVSQSSDFDDNYGVSNKRTLQSTLLGDEKRKPINKRRTLRRLQKFARLPVWPAWNGALIWAVGLLLGNTISSELEDKITGRVCPNFFSMDNDPSQSPSSFGDDDEEEDTVTSPFLLLVHHCHSFAAWDPLRFFQRSLILPEGFPAHPHRGFITLTYFLHGGFRHRDSMGVEQFYGVIPKQSQPQQNQTPGPAKGNDRDIELYPHSQWLNTGAGLLHEEMFDLSSRHSSNNWFQRHELYQIWINVPASKKMDAPRTYLLADNVDTPVVLEQEGRVQIRVLAGNYRNQHQASTPIVTEILVLHVSLDPDTTWTCPLPREFETCVLYLRQGLLQCLEKEKANKNTPSQDATTNTVIPPHYTAFLSKRGEELTLQSHGGKKADFMLLTGVPIREPCVARGSMVMTTADEINRAYADYQAGFFGVPWDHELSQEQWKEHVQNFPSRYR